MSYRDRSRGRDSRGRGRSRSRGYGGGARSYGGGGYGGGDRFGGFGGGKGKGKGGGAGLGANLRKIDWDREHLQPIVKNFYRESATVANMSPQEVQQLRNQLEVTVVDTGAIPCPNPIMAFEDAGFPYEVLSSLKAAGFEKPSPIQSQGWPVALSGRDMIGIAQTGSGKTLAFLLPAIVHMKAQEPLRRGEGPICTVLAPTRELAMQIKVETDKFGSSAGVRNVCVYGGTPKGQQARELRDGAEIVIATPGRLIDFLDNQTVNLRRCTYLCLDEADRMLDMGFEDQVRKICGQIRPDRQTLLWSATWPKAVQSLARDLCREQPVHINIGSGALKANPRIAQKVEVMSGYDKRQRLVQVLQEQLPLGKVIIFAETKRGCDDLTRQLRQDGYPALSIHGDKEQQERDWVLSEFRSGKNPILIATDVAARGLDVKDIMCVINYDFPNNVEDYVHRIGRTARAGAHGTAYTFFTSDKARFARELSEFMRSANQEVPAALDDLARSGGCGGGKGGRGFGGKGKGRFGGGFGGGYGGGYGGRY